MTLGANKSMEKLSTFVPTSYKSIDFSHNVTIIFFQKKLMMHCIVVIRPRKDNVNLVKYGTRLHKQTLLNIWYIFYPINTHVLPYLIRSIPFSLSVEANEREILFLATI